jgi:enoyl-[acyl-carrier protein] reductase III
MPAGSNVIALTSLGSQRVLPDYGLRGVSKAALESLVRYLAVELGPDGIRVNCVSPGVADTDALKSFPLQEQLKDAQRRSPLGRLVTPEDVSNAVMFLISEHASMITGHILVVDGGAALPWGDGGTAGT